MKSLRSSGVASKHHLENLDYNVKEKMLIKAKKELEQLESSE
jgi:hypothetical protein